jgi:hypothetical protein
MAGTEKGASNDGNEVAMSLEERALLASLPFRALENWQVPANYERSVKFSRDGIFANRYLLALTQADVPLWQVATELNQLRMPQRMLARFVELFPVGSKWMMGFEEGARRSTYRAYVEFAGGTYEGNESPPGPLAKGHSQEGELSHFGFKWDAATGVATETSQYWYVPALTIDELGAVVHPAVAKASRTIGAVVNGVMELVDSDAAKVKLLVTSDDSGRRISIDLNLYELELHVGDIIPLLQVVATEWGLNGGEFQRLKGLCQDSSLGHVSFGTSVLQDEFVTVYFEPAVQGT